MKGYKKKLHVTEVAKQPPDWQEVHTIWNESEGHPFPQLRSGKARRLRAYAALWSAILRSERAYLEAQYHAGTSPATPDPKFKAIFSALIRSQYLRFYAKTCRRCILRAKEWPAPCPWMLATTKYLQELAVDKPTSRRYRYYKKLGRSDCLARIERSK